MLERKRLKVIERVRASLYVIEVSLSEAHITVGLIHAVFVFLSASDSVKCFSSSAIDVVCLWMLHI